MRDGTFTNVVTAGETVVKNGPGYLNAIVLNSAPASTLKLYDAASITDTATLIATVAASTAATTLGYEGKLTKGFVILNGDAVRATATLTSDATNVTDGDTVTIDGKVYRFKDTMAAVNDVKRGASAAVSLDNLKAAINGTGTAGTEWFAGTVAHTTVTATTNTDTTQVIQAIHYGTAGNAIVVSEASTHLSWGSVSGGAEGSAFNLTASVS